jgi:hypothetical protein
LSHHAEGFFFAEVEEFLRVFAVEARKYWYRYGEVELFHEGLQCLDFHLVGRHGFREGHQHLDVHLVVLFPGHVVDFLFA